MIKCFNMIKRFNMSFQRRLESSNHELSARIWSTGKCLRSGCRYETRLYQSHALYLRGRGVSQAYGGCEIADFGAMMTIYPNNILCGFTDFMYHQLSKVAGLIPARYIQTIYSEASVN